MNIPQPSYSYKRQGDKYVRTMTSSGYGTSYQGGEPPGYKRDRVDSSNNSGAIFYTKRNPDTGVVERFDRRELLVPVMKPSQFGLPAKQATYQPGGGFMGFGKPNSQSGLLVFEKRIDMKKTGYAPGSMAPGGRQATPATRRNDPVLAGASSDGGGSGSARSRRMPSQGGTILTPLGGKTILG